MAMNFNLGDFFFDQKNVILVMLVGKLIDSYQRFKLVHEIFVSGPDFIEK